MILKEMIDTLRMPQRMQIRDEEGWEICTCNTNSEGVLPYMNCVVTEWFGNYHVPENKADFVVFVKDGKDAVTMTKGRAKAKNVAEGKKAYTANATVFKVRKEDDQAEEMKNETYQSETD